MKLVNNQSGQSYDIKFHFTCHKSNLYQNPGLQYLECNNSDDNDFDNNSNKASEQVSLPIFQ